MDKFEVQICYNFNAETQFKAWGTYSTHETLVQAYIEAMKINNMPRMGIRVIEVMKMMQPIGR